MIRPALSAAAAVGVAAGAMLAGVATQNHAPAAPVIILAAAADTDAETAQQDAIARVVAEMTREEDPDNWDSRYGDGT